LREAKASGSMAAPRKLRRRTPRRPEQCPGDLHDYADLPAPRQSKSQPCPASDRIERVLGYPWPFAGRPPKDDLSTWTVTDDWPDLSVVRTFGASRGVN